MERDDLAEDLFRQKEAGNLEEGVVLQVIDASFQELFALGLELLEAGLPGLQGSGCACESIVEVQGCWNRCYERLD